jgi:hypothetical protein
MAAFAPEEFKPEKATWWILEDAAHRPIQRVGQRQSAHICQASVSLDQGFPPNGEIPEENEALAGLHFKHSMHSSICILGGRGDTEA